MATNKQIGVTLAFTADTKAAIANIKNLQSQLTNLTTGASFNKEHGIIGQLTPEIQKAMSAASQLKANLEAATNAKTGKLNLTQFNNSLKQSGISLKDYAAQLNALGPEGQQAFSQLAQSIMQAETPMIRISGLLKGFGQTLANTIRWQLSSSLLTGFTSAISKAYNYAQDLNESLNNIRIVTGYSADQMDQFAAKANKAAKALSTTTTAYTDASLIFYQQGLTDEEVLARTEVTIKMANAAGESASKVSDQLTAVWNNFYDGSKSLEYYADVMTKLGAATASSTDEIAEGLEKFAAISSTVGLSYEYATAALATVTSNTRESADVVGTAFKTIFGRMQDLELGNTLDDGTTLGSYSQAMAKVGIEVLDTNGNLIKMDDILDQMAVKWDKLSNAQQVALAQSVAGARQYNQLMALMNNWDNGDADSMVANLKYVKESSGALQEQFDIYSEGWEAAKDRVTAAAEEIYTKLLNDDFFIDFLDIIESLLEGVGSLIDAFGGLKGVLLTIGAIATTLFQNQIAQGIRNITTNIQTLFGITAKRERATKEETNKIMQSMRSMASGETGVAENDARDREYQMQKKIVAASKRASAEKLKQLQYQADLVRMMDKQVIVAAKDVDKTKEKVENIKNLNAAYARMDAEEKARNSQPKTKGQIDYQVQQARYNKAAELMGVDASASSREKRAAYDLINEDAAKGNKEAQEMLEQIKAAGDAVRAELKAQINKTKEELVQEAGDKASAESRKQDAAAEHAANYSARATDLKNTAQKYDTTGKNEKELALMYETLKEKISKTKAEAEALMKNLDDPGAEEAVKKQVEALSKLERRLEEAKDDTSALQGVIKDLGKENGDIDASRTTGTQILVNTTAKRFGEDTESPDAKEQVIAYQNAAAARVGRENAEFNARYQQGIFNNSFTDGSKGLTDYASKITMVSSTIMTLGSTITSVQAAFNTFNNPDASTWDKISAVFTGLVVPGLTLVSTAIRLHTEVTKKDTEANYANAASQAAKYWYIALIAAVVAGLAIAILALANAETAEEKAIRKANEARQAANDALEETKEKTDKIKQAYENYQSVYEALEKAEKGTKEWNEALANVNNTVLEMMTEFPELFQLFNLLNDKDGILTINIDEMEKAIDYMEQLQARDQWQATYFSANASYVSSKQTLEGQVQDELLDGEHYGNYDNFEKTNTAASKKGGFWAYSLDSDNISSILSANADLLSGLSGEEYQERLKEILKSNADSISFYDGAERNYTVTNDDGTSYLATEYASVVGDLSDDTEAFNTIIDSIAESCVGVQEAFNTTGKEVDAFAERMKQSTRLMVQELLPEEDGATQRQVAAWVEQKTSDYADAYYAIMTDNEIRSGGSGKKLTEAEVKAATGWTGDLSNNVTKSDSNGNNNEVYKFILQELRKAGYNWSADTDNAILGSDTNRRFNFRDAEGNLIEDKSAEWIAQTLAASKAMKEAGTLGLQAINEYFEQVTQNIQKIEKTVGDSKQALSNSEQEQMEIIAKNFIANQDLGDLNQSDFQLLKDSGMNISTEDGAKAFLSQVLGIDGTDEAAANQAAIDRGFDSYQDMLYALQSSGASLGNIYSDETLFKGKFKIDGLDEASASVVEEFQKKFSTLDLTSMGQSIKKQLVDTINSGLEGLSPEKQQEALEALANINWSSYDAMDEAAETIRSFGGVVDTTSEAWANLVDNMRRAQNAVPDFSAISSQLSGVVKILNGLDFGSTIQDEDYKTLIAYNEAWKDFFVLQADGTRKFIGDAGQMKQATIDEANAARNELDDLAKAQEDFIAAGWGRENEDGTKHYLTAEDWRAKSGTETSVVKNMLENSNTEANQAVFKGTGYDALEDQERLQKAADTVDQYKNREDLSEEQQTEYNEAVAMIEEFYNRVGDFQDADYGEQNEDWQEKITSTATSLIDLQDLTKDNELSTSVYSKALKGMAGEYAECDKELKAYNKALEVYGEDSEEAKKAQKDLEKALNDAQWRKMTKAVKGYYDELQSLTDVEEIAKKQQEMADSFNELWGTSVSSSWVAENMALIDEWANATGDRATELAIEIQQKAVWASTSWNKILEDNSVVANIDIDGDGEPDAFKSKWEQLKAIVEANPITINADGRADMTQLIAELVKAGWTAQEVANYLASIGETDLTLIGEGFPDGAKDMDVQEFASWLAENSGNLGNIFVTGNAPATGIANMSNYGSGGGGGSKKKADKVKKSDVVDRYKEVTDKIDNVTRAMEASNTQADRLYGPNRKKEMKKVNALLAEEVDLLKQKEAEAREYLAEDQNALIEAATEAGVTFTFDAETGDITNYTEVMTGLWQKLDNLIEEANADGNADESEQEAIEAQQELIDAVKEAIEQYDETKELIQDTQEEIQDKLNEIQDNNQTMWKDGLDVRIEEADMFIEGLEYAIEKYSDSFNTMVTAFEFMGSKMEATLDKQNDYAAALADLQKLWQNGDISEADYIEDLQELYSTSLDQAKELLELDEEVVEYYSTALELASDELAKYTDQMEHLTDVLDHYKSIIELVNGEYDYESIGKILEGQAKVLADQLKVASQNYEMLAKQKEEIERKLAEAETDAERELWEKALEDITTTVNEAQEEMLSMTEEWAEAQKAILENAMAEAAAEMEKAFTQGMGFDAVSSSLDRLSSYADEYLTKTNQIYETQKLINMAQQAIDKTTNEAAKARLKAYNDEIAQLQSKNKLSNLELEIAKAKYDIVLAEIALEEAQNAKSVVRLQRDSEGNFGYVYTADQEAISNAEQELADKQNSLYNIALEGTNNYGQKVLELNQQLADDLVALEEARAAGQYATDEEYQAAKEKLLAEYYNLYSAYSEQYSISLQTDSRVIADAWVNAYADMITGAQNWEAYVSDYLANAEESFNRYSDSIAACEQIQNLLNDTASAAESVAQASEDLSAAIEEVINQTDEELNALQNKMEEYGKLRDSILDTIKAYEDLAKAAINAYQIVANPDYDPTLDYSKLMGEVEYGSDLYQKYKKYRDLKLSNSEYDIGFATTKRVDAFYQKGYTLPYGSKTDFTQFTEEDWMKLVGFKSGGYTGSWGPEGRLAVLHQKELVLNANDTENFLLMIDQMRDIISMIDLKALQNQMTTISSGFGASTGELEQNVHIEANFPNVTDKNEIQEAFGNLVNLAAQYANRK